MIQLNLDSFSLGQKRILEKINFQADQASLINIVGPNGSGKTTLLKILAGLYKLQNGHLNFSVIDDKISFLSQKSELAEDITINDYLRLAGFKVCKGQLGRFKKYLPEITSLMECLGLSHSLETSIGHLSGGEFQKWRIIAATYWDPEVLLLDEPCSFLDPKHQDEILKLLKFFVHNKKKTVVIVSHDINQVLNSMGQVFGLKKGQIVFSGFHEDFHNSSVLENLFDKKFNVTTVGEGRYAL